MSIEYVHAPISWEELLTLVNKQQPVVFRDAISHWPIMTNREEERLDYLVARAGRQRIVYTETPLSYNGLLSYKDDDSLEPNFRRRSCDLTTFAAIVRQNVTTRQESLVYLQSLSIPESMPSMSEEFTLPMLNGVPVLDGARIWIGQGGHRTATHYDSKHNLACVVAGKKRFVLFPPEQLRNMYIGSLSKTPAGTPVSMVDVREPNLERYPRFKQALSCAETLELIAGDVLFLPAYWFHYVESEQLNILVNLWWDDVPARVVNDAETCLKFARLTVRDLPPHRRHIVKQFFEHFIFQCSGDPYEHIPVDQQGWLGQLSQAEDTLLRDQVIADVKQLVTRHDESMFDWRRHWRIHDSVSFRIRASKVMIRRSVGPEWQIPDDLFDTLMAFVTPATPDDVFQLLSQLGTLDRGEVERRIRYLLVEGLLARHDGE